MGPLAALGASKSADKLPCCWPSPGFVPVEQAAGEVEVRRGNVCRLASVALKGGPGLGRWAAFDAVYAPLIIEVAENVEMSY